MVKNRKQIWLVTFFAFVWCILSLSGWSLTNLRPKTQLAAQISQRSTDALIAGNQTTDPDKK